MKKDLLLLCFIVLMIPNLVAQNETESPKTLWESQLHPELGFTFPTGAMRDHIAIRQNIGTFYNDQSSDGNLSTITVCTQAGLKWVLFNTKLNVGISAGLRYTSYQTELTGSASGSTDFLYLRYEGEGIETKFARIKSISEKNDFISIPIELSYKAYQYRYIGLFARAGIDFGVYRLRNETTIDFHNQEMVPYQQEVLASVEMPTNSYYSTLYGTLGLQYRKENKAGFSFELYLPSLFLSKDNFSLTNQKTFSGFRISINIPLTHTKQSPII